MYNRESKILIIVPSYNESMNIEQTLTHLSQLKTHFANLQICVINDGSHDDTSQKAKTFDVVVIDLPFNLGIGSAVQTGYKYAFKNDYDIAIQFDADGQHNVEDLIDLLTPIFEDEADMVVGSRFVEKTDYKGALSRRIGIFYFYFLLKVLTGKRFTDPTSGYRAKTKPVIKEFAESYPKDYPEPEVLVSLTNKKFRIKEIKVNMKDRQGGKSSINLVKSVYYMGKVSLSIIMQKLK